jgi:hypothetical protein
MSNNIKALLHLYIFNTLKRYCFHVAFSPSFSGLIAINAIAPARKHSAANRNNSADVSLFISSAASGGPAATPINLSEL